MDLDLQVERSGEDARLRLGGTLGGAERPIRLRETVERLVGEGVRRFALDMGGLSYVDSVGLGELVFALKRVMAEGGTLEITEASPRVDYVLRLTGLDAVLRPMHRRAPLREPGAMSEVPATQPLPQRQRR